MNDTFIVSFTGRQQKFGIDTKEFRGTLASIGYNNVLFVTDESKSWYNAPGIFKRIKTQIDNYIKENNITKVTFLGASMGGFGAILFSHVYQRCDRVIAFAPQIHIDPKLTKDKDDRFIPSLNKIIQGSYTYPTVVDKFRDDVKYDIAIGKVEEDNWNVGLIKPKKNIRIHKFKNAGHNVPRYLKEQNQLDTFIKDLLEK